MAIKQRLSVEELCRIEHAYAHPYSSAKDPVAISGYVANNILSGKMTPLYWREMLEADKSKVTIVDVRTKDEASLGSIDGAINIPLDELRERINEIPRNKAVYLFCEVGLRGYLASNILKENGYNDVRNLIGGLKTYETATMPVPPATETSDKKSNENNIADRDTKIVRIDACGIQCPGPIIKLKKSIETIQPGERIELIATDAGFPSDAEAWCSTTGNKFIGRNSKNGIHSVIIEKSTPHANIEEQTLYDTKGKTFILFSDDLDKTLATFVLANGAAATGRKVSIFFTFWGLNTIKKTHKPKVKKDFWSKMFSFMLPSDSTKLSLSKLNMLGIGAKVMRYLMKKKGVDSLESLRQQAIDNGVEFIACQMSMDVMGIKREELLDEVNTGGVATYMQRAQQSNVNLFI